MTAVMRIASGKILTVSTGQQPQLYLTTDAGKPSPGVGDIAICYDTGKNYTCYVNGVWTLVSSPARHGYNNHLGITDNIMISATNGTATATTNAGTHSMDLSSGLAAGVVQASYKSAMGFNTTLVNFEFNALVQNIVNGAQGSNRFTLVGMIQALNNYLGAYFQQENVTNLWSCVSSDGITPQQTYVTVSSGDLLTITGKGSKLLFYINGSIVANHSLVLPSNIYYPTVLIDGNAAITTARQISIDYIGFEVML